MLQHNTIMYGRCRPAGQILWLLSHNRPQSTIKHHNSHFSPHPQQKPSSSSDGRCQKIFTELIYSWCLSKISTDCWLEAEIYKETQFSPKIFHCELTAHIIFWQEMVVEYAKRSNYPRSCGGGEMMASNSCGIIFAQNQLIF